MGQMSQRSEGCVLKMEEGATNHGMQVALETEKARKQISHPSFQKELSCRQLDLSPVKLSLKF